MPKIRRKKSGLINKYKLIYVPMLIGVLAIFTVSTASYMISKSLLINQMKEDGINMALLMSGKISKDLKAREVISELIDEKLTMVGRGTLMGQWFLSDEYLENMAKYNNIDEIHWFDSTGKITHSTHKERIGWTAYSGHPVDNFRLRRENEFIDEIRKDIETGSNVKYGYFRSFNQNFVQVGISAGRIEEFTQKYTYQSIVEDLASESNVEYALIVDLDLIAVADSDIEDLGVNYTGDYEYENALLGEVSAIKWYYHKTKSNVVEVAVPLYYNNEIIGVLGIGLSMDRVRSYIYFIFISSTLIALIIVSLTLFIQNRNIVKPVKELDGEIRRIDVETNGGFRIPIPKRDTFLGLSNSINTILDKIDTSFQQLKDQEEYIANMAFHDSLTNLPNRRRFVEKLEDELNKQHSGAVILLDIDNFKEINDTLGHVYGDKVLKSIGEAFLSISDKNVFASRFGGDEFLILLTGMEEVDEITVCVENILDIFHKINTIEDNKIRISCSIGIALYPLHSTSGDQLVINADIAMYKAKQSGKNQYKFFDEIMFESLKEKIKIENVLRKALQEKDLKLVFQPQVCTYTGKIISFEALLRLKSTNISPAKFIPVAESTGLILPIGRWVTEEAIKQIDDWRRKGFNIKPIAINFSVKQLDDLGYTKFLEEKLKEYDVEAKYIEIEITETLVLESNEKTKKILKRLKEVGVKIALDDFGTGYSALSYLTYLPVEKIKLDKSLSDRFLESNNVKVIDGIISLAHNLNLEVVAEGIEQYEQYQHLKLLACNFIQGYFFSPPMDVEEIEKVYNNTYIKSDPSS